MRKICFVLLAGLSSMSWATEMDLNLNNDSARFGIVWPLSGQKADVEGGFLFNENDATLGHIGIHITGNTGNRSQPVSARIGGRFYGGGDDIVDVFVAAIGGSVLIKPPNIYDRLILDLNAHYGPDVINFADGENFIEYGAKVIYQIVPRAYVYGGYRKIRLSQAVGRRVVDSGLHIGLKISF